MKRTILLVSLASAVIFYNSSCTNSDASTETKHSLSLENMDSSVRPGDNFYLYANGTWFKKNEIPPTESRIGAGLEMYNRTKERVRGILEESAKANAAAGTVEQQVGDFYAAGMDSAAIEKAGYDPVKPFLKKIGDIKDTKGVLQFVADQATYNNSVLMGSYVGADEKNSMVNIAVFYQAGLGLPDRDYYFKTDEPTQKVVKAYQGYMQKLFVLTGDDSATATKNMMAVYDLEKQMAKSHRTNVELRDPQSNYNKMAVADMDKKMPAIGWPAVLHDLGINADSVNISQPGFYMALNDLLKTVPVETWKTYLRVNLLNDAAGALSSDFVNAAFEYQKALSGQQQIKPRWERIYRQTDGNLGEALGQLYVKKYFTEDAKKRMLELVNNLQKAFEARINKLEWMSDSTKKKAIEKLYTFIKKIGYPDKWRDYSRVTIDKNKYFDNLLSCGKNEYAFQVAKVGKPVDRTEWGITTPTIDAYYNPTFNEIVFPAGILQYPMFDPGNDDAMNYGGIGMVIGHEMTHGFDDQGAQYDKEGNLKNWWSKEDFAKFKEKGMALAKLYSSFVVLDSIHINGQLTQGENTADVGGVAIAYDAFKLTKQGQDTTKVDGFTPDQRFFLSVAQCWRRKAKDEAIRQQINTDPHSPSMYRVWGPLMNNDAFYKAFDVKEGDRMFLAEKDRVRIW